MTNRSRWMGRGMWGALAAGAVASLSMNDGHLWSVFFNKTGYDFVGDQVRSVVEVCPDEKLGPPKFTKATLSNRTAKSKRLLGRANTSL